MFFGCCRSLKIVICKDTQYNICDSLFPCSDGSDFDLKSLDFMDECGSKL